MHVCAWARSHLFNNKICSYIQLKPSKYIHCDYLLRHLHLYVHICMYLSIIVVLVSLLFQLFVVLFLRYSFPLAFGGDIGDGSFARSLCHFACLNFLFFIIFVFVLLTFHLVACVNYYNCFACELPNFF